MPLYVIQAGDTGPCKIGLAGDVAQRLYSLQNGHYETLRLLHAFDGGRKEEYALHQRFASALIIREWFHPVPAILAGDFGLPRLRLAAQVESAPVNAPRAQKGQGSTDTAVGRIIALCGGSGEVCRAIDVPQNTVTYWSIRNSIPARYWAGVSAMTLGRVSVADLAALRAHKNGEPDCNPLAVTELPADRNLFPHSPLLAAETQHKERAT